MPSGPNTALCTAPATEPRLRPAAPVTGHVDGAWWPRTRELTPELPTLLAAAAARPGRIDALTMIGRNRHRPTLLVVPPGTSPANLGNDSRRLLAARGTAAERGQPKGGLPLPA
jgi:hypothetical protein